jgi:hypothetical protein
MYLVLRLVISPKLVRKNLIFIGILKVTLEKGRIRFRFRNLVVRIRGSDPYQNVTDLEHQLCPK